MKKKQEKVEAAVEVMTVQKVRLTMHIIGLTPLILNRMPKKAWEEFLLPSIKKSKGDRVNILKHDPVAEFRNAIGMIHDDDADTLIGMPAVAFKTAMCSAAVDMPGGATKAAMGRMTYVLGEVVGIYGVPKLKMDIVKLAGMSRTPDVRTRACLPKWGCTINVEFIVPVVTDRAVVNLMSGAGIMQGVGDYRVEKGKGNYGQFELCREDNPRFEEVRETGGRAAQIEAMENPECYDADTAELLAWFTNEVGHRRLKREKEEIQL